MQGEAERRGWRAVAMKSSKIQHPSAVAIVACVARHVEDHARLASRTDMVSSIAFRAVTGGTVFSGVMCDSASPANAIVSATMSELAPMPKPISSHSVLDVMCQRPRATMLVRASSSVM